MGESDFTCPECNLVTPHTHGVAFNAFGRSVPCIIHASPPSDGKVIRDSESGEIIFAARRDRVHVVPTEES